MEVKIYTNGHGPEDLKKAYEDTYQKIFGTIILFRDKHYRYMRQATYLGQCKGFIFMGLFKNWIRGYIPSITI